MDKIEEINLSGTELESEMDNYWDKRSLSYSKQNTEQFNSNKRLSWESYIFNGIDESKELRILDIGTGPGLFAIMAALRGHNVSAVDMNEGMLDKAKINAKSSGASIDFRKVGHELPFEDQTFDVIISRDVTWTLTEPENQLEYWAKKLKVGGVLRYFDAEWYYYLRNDDYRRAWNKDREENIKNGCFTYNEAYKLEKIAEQLPMTYKNRPEWDKQYWSKKIGFDFDIRENINPFVYSEKEQIQYKLFPEFLVTVRRNF